jgi:hypothetical protein
MYRLLVFLFTAVVIATAADAAQMYRWVDENGVTHFSSHQPPRQNADKTELKGGSLNQQRTNTQSQQLANIERRDLETSTWQGCDSSLCQVVQQIDPDCLTSFCSRAKTYSNECTSAGCLTKKLAFESEMQDRLSAQEELQRQQAINANATPIPPASQNQAASQNQD